MQIHIQISGENIKWLKKMEANGVGRSALVNLAIDILKPRLKNVGATEKGISESIAERRGKKQLALLTKPDHLQYLLNGN